MPQSTGSVPAGDWLPAFLIGPVALPQATATAPAAAAAPGGGQSIRVCVLTVSDRASQGVYADASGPAVVSCLSGTPGLPFSAAVVGTAARTPRNTPHAHLPIV